MARIRFFRDEDAAALAALFHASVHQVGSRDYSQEQVSVWSPATPEPEQFVRRSRDGRIFLVAVNDAEEPIAYGDLEPDGHIDHLYCRPDVIGTGVASALYDQLENAAIDRGYPALQVDASETARIFFERKGFSVQHRKDFILDGVAIHNYRMVKFI